MAAVIDSINYVKKRSETGEFHFNILSLSIWLIPQFRSGPRTNEYSEGYVNYR